VEQLEGRIVLSDGAGAGTVLVKDFFNPTSGVSPIIEELGDLNGTLLVDVQDGGSGFQGVDLWKSNGTTADTTLVAGVEALSPFTVLGNTAFFEGEDATTLGSALFETNGTSAGTFPIDTGNLSNPNNLTNVNGTLFFSGFDFAHGTELWKSDGTATGTVLVKDINAGSGSSVPRYLTNVNGALFFVASDGTSTGSGLWRSDGTAAGTVLVKGGISAANLTDVNGKLFFAGNDGKTGWELWDSDGTTKGTQLVKDIYTGSTNNNYHYYGHFHRKFTNSSYPMAMTEFNGALFFSADDGKHGRELWKSDGTSAGTVLVKDINPGIGGSYPGGVFSPSMTVAGGTLYFSAIDGTSGNELWKSDGTTAGTVPVNPGVGGSNPSNLTSAGSTLFFTANDAIHGVELWKSDGTTAGTVLVKDINPGSAGSYPRLLTVSGGHLFFSVKDATDGDQLWDPPILSAPVPSTLTVLNNRDSGAGSLRDAITNAKSGDTVVFDPSLNGQTITLTSGELAFSKGLDIEGPGASLLAISGNNASRVFDISQNQTPVTVTIAGLTIENGLSPSDGRGGGIYNVSSTLNLVNDVLSNNVARGNSDNGAMSGGNSGNSGDGGAVSNWHGAALTVSNCTFSGNQAIAGDNSGSGQARGGAIALDGSCTGAISGSLFTGNVAQGGNGVTVTHSTAFPGNAFGGAIKSWDKGTLTVQGCTFCGNQAIGGSDGSGPNSNTTVPAFDLDAGLGGAIDVFRTTLTVSNSTFSYNQAVGGANCTALFGEGHAGDGGGGAIHFTAGAATITDSTFDHNLAQGGNNNTGASNVFIVGWGHGGAITNDGWPQFGVSESLTASGVTFTNNRAIGGAGNAGVPLAGDGIGGALDNWVAGVLTLSNSIMQNNQAIGGAGAAGQNGADGLGGAIANLLGATATLSNCTITGNQAIGGAGGSGANGGNGFGGGLYNQGNSLFGTSSLTVTGSTVTSNSATGGAAGSGGSAGQGVGGGVYFASGGVVCLDLFTSLNISGNTASTSNNDVFGVFMIC
jgi:ELWxxDGT repeat protein